MAPRVSLTMIVRDEEARLPACLRSAADLVHEVVVVDTGSADRTREVAAGFGAKVIDFAWADDFAAARNESLRHASGDWAFWMDADEWLDEANRGRLRLLFAGLGDGNVGYVMTQRSPTRFLGGAAGEQLAYQVRLFRKLPAVRWEFRVFEQIRPSVRRSGGVIVPTDVVIEHDGYRDAAGMRARTERNLRLALLQEADQPGDPYNLAHIGDLLCALGRPVEGVPYLRRALAGLPAGSAIHAHVSQSLARAERALPSTI